MMPTAMLLLEHASELVTIAGGTGPRRGTGQGDLAIVEDGAVAIGKTGRIIAVGRTTDVSAAVTLAGNAQVIEARGRTVLPGFVDAHTHAIFGGERIDEFVRRLGGADYLTLLTEGGGILSTVEATRKASSESLTERAAAFLKEMLNNGTTTVEIKSGYGLSVADELKMLRVARALRDVAKQQIVPTFLGAHAVPREYAGRSDEYVGLVIDEMIPQVAAEGLARFCDVYCERDVFSVAQARRVLEAGRRYGLLPKIHAEQRTALGGAQLAAEVGAVSADHLERASDEAITALAAAGTCAVLLPGASFMLMDDELAPARSLIGRGVPIALATDFNPGTSPILSMQVVIALACLRRLLTPAEAIVAATRNAAYAVGLGQDVGSLEPGKRGDLIVLDAPSHSHIPYWFARNLVSIVIKDGQVVVPN